MAKGGNLFSIPGTKRIKYLEENVSALNYILTKEELEEIDNIAPKDVAAGTRYTEAGMKIVNV